MVLKNIKYLIVLFVVQTVRRFRLRTAILPYGEHEFFPEDKTFF